MSDMSGMETTVRIQPSQQEQETGRRGRTLTFLVILLLILGGGGGYFLFPLTRDLPKPTVDDLIDTSYRIPGTLPNLPWPSVGQAVVDIEGVGRFGSSGDSAPIPIASVAKVMTAYVILTSHPLDVGEPGPSLTVSEEQALAYTQESARDESLVLVRAGSAFTERQALEAVLLPSANNMARILAAWDAGTISAFVAKMNQTAASLGMAHTRYTDPAGYDPGTVSSASDQVILTRRAMALPAFAEIVAESKATLPVAGIVSNYNTILGQDGVVGVKTGSTDQSGGCFTFAAQVTVSDRKVMIVGAVLGQPGSNTPQQLASAFAVTRALIRTVGRTLVVHTVIQTGQQVAMIRGPLGATTKLTASQDISVLGWPGMDVQISANIPTVPTKLASGAEHGGVSVKAGENTMENTALRSTNRLDEPTTWTRIKRHK